MNRSIYNDYDIPKDAEPLVIGSGSIGQVYKLYNISLQQYVAIKIRHPEIERRAQSFSTTLTYLMNIISIFWNVPFQAIIHDFIDTFSMQMDYIQEAENTNMLRGYFQKELHITIPTVYEYSNNTIVTSYHDGVSIISIHDERLKYILSIDLSMFIQTSMLLHDFTHCDMHHGNFKVNIHDNGDYQIIVYDCGMIATTSNKHINKEVIKCCFSGNYKELVPLMTKQNCSQKQKDTIVSYIDEIECIHYECPLDRLRDIICFALMLGITLDKNLVKIIHGMIIIDHNLTSSVNFISKLLKSLNHTTMLFIRIWLYREFTKKFNKYKQLGLYLDEWLNEYRHCESSFREWMLDTFGHDDENILLECLLCTPMSTRLEIQGCTNRELHM
jgi:hypothetical protein